MARARRKSRVRSAGKVEERDLLDAARLHLDEPDLVQVACLGRHLGPFCPVRRLNADLARVHEKRDDEDWLAARSKRGRGLVKGYAGTLLLAKADEIAYLAQMKLPFGTFPYAMRGTASAAHYLGLQHWDDARLRLLAWTDMAKKRRYRFFAVGERVVCAHRRGRVPEAYVPEQAERLGLVAAGEGLWTCAHPTGTPAVTVTWRSAGARVRVCAACNGGRNTAHALLEHAIVPRAARDLEVAVEDAPIAGAGPVESGDPKADRAYLDGGTTDAGLLEAHEAARRRALLARPPPFFVSGSTATTEAAQFIATLGATPAERRALEAALADPPRAVVLDRPSAARALEAVWRERGRAALAAAGQDPAAADVHEPDARAERIADLVRRAETEGARRRGEAGLPRYVRLAGPARVADAAARALRRGDRDAALRALDDAEPGAPRAVAFAVRRHVGGAESHAWKYSQEEKELADALAEPVRALVDSDARSYHDRLVALTRAAGSLDELRREP